MLPVGSGIPGRRGGEGRGVRGEGGKKASSSRWKITAIGQPWEPDKGHSSLLSEPAHSLQPSFPVFTLQVYFPEEIWADKEVTVWNF